eukprot:2686914-Prorocentrum_lima.AAC.1
MTSSLVGSEMCIRDRTNRFTVTNVAANQMTSTPIAAGVEGITKKTCPTSVSYTHLTLPTICSV